MNAAQSPLNRQSHQALEDYLHLAGTDLNARPSVRTPVRELLAKLLGGNAKDYALTTSTGVGVSTVAAGHEWKAGDNVVLPAGEHWNSTFPWFRLEAQGVEVRTVQPGPDHRVSVDALAEKVDQNTRILSTTAVRFDTGFRADLAALAEVARSCDALLVVDGIQSAGAQKMDVTREGIDVLACGGFKWLLGMAGTGFLYASERAQDRIAPVSPGMFAAEHSFSTLNYHNDARRYETGSLAYALFHGWAEGLRVLDTLGIDQIEKRNLQLTDMIIEGLNSKGFDILSPVSTPKERSAIVSFSVGSKEQNALLAERLERENVLVSFRGETIRVSPNFYNSEDDIDRFLSLL